MNETRESTVLASPSQWPDFLGHTALAAKEAELNMGLDIPERPE